MLAKRSFVLVVHAAPQVHGIGVIKHSGCNGPMNASGRKYICAECGGIARNAGPANQFKPTTLRAREKTLFSFPATRRIEGKVKRQPIPWRPVDASFIDKLPGIEFVRPGLLAGVEIDTLTKVRAPASKFDFLFACEDQFGGG
jgi:hypothetical protein